MKEPKEVLAVYDLLKRLIDEKKVDPEEAIYYLKKAIESEESHGIWIRKEEERKSGIIAVSVLNINFLHSLLGIHLKAKR
jgi:hypothetical protein